MIGMDHFEIAAVFMNSIHAEYFKAASPDQMRVRCYRIGIAIHGCQFQGSAVVITVMTAAV